MRRVWIFLLLMNLANAQTQGVPNFSGSWKMNLSKSKLPKHSQLQSESLVIKQNGSLIEFHADINGRQSVESWTTDKQERVVREVPGAGNILGKAYWKGTTLITESWAALKLPNSPLNNSEVIRIKTSWTVSSDGLVLTERSESEDFKTVTVYDKQQ